MVEGHKSTVEGHKSSFEGHNLSLEGHNSSLEGQNSTVVVVVVVVVIRGVVRRGSRALARWGRPRDDFKSVNARTRTRATTHYARARA